ncbi:pentapeptide repeat-containing protein [Nocardiopsis terrae]|uniref:pentapeptide repeat-containing protein n=1 Tax=Streptomyces sp. NPDC057554 TaxID=3350538 RepID=UPI0036AB55C5
MRFHTPRRMPSFTRGQWMAIVITMVALPGLLFTVWPLFPAVAGFPGFLVGLLPDPLSDWLSKDRPTWRLLWGLLFASGLVAVVLLISHRKPQSLLGLLIIAAWAAALLAVGVMALVIWHVLGSPPLQETTELTRQGLDAIFTRAFAVIAGLGGVALLVISYRRQRTTESGEQREVTKLFTDTFDSASDKLGSEHAAVRLAGVHALARLADEAPPGREDLVQMVIDVMCAYLRMPYARAPDALAKNASRVRREEYRERELAFISAREVRHTIIRIIGDRLREDTRWRGKNYDFTGVVFDGGDLSGAHFSDGYVSFMGAEFSGGYVSFMEAEFSGARVSFSAARFSGGKVNFGIAQFSSGNVNFTNAEFSGGRVNFRTARFSGGRVDFSLAQFSGGQVRFTMVEFSGGSVNFPVARFSGGRVDFRSAQFSGGHVSFGSAKFSGGHVDFRGADFFGGRVDFAKVSGTCPAGLLHAAECGMPGVLMLPEQWRPATSENGRETGPSVSAHGPSR